MNELVWTPLTETLMITAFVSVMMIAVEYLSVLSRGAFQHVIGGARWMQYTAAALLGALPGCLGPFSIVALYAHRAVSFGAVVTTMIATSGDEAFVMLSLFPATALWLSVGHGMLPVLAESRRDFIRVKAVNLAIGFAVGAFILALGF